VEGDSTLATQIGKKIQHGIEVDKISKKWRLRNNSMDQAEN